VPTRRTTDHLRDSLESMLSSPSFAAPRFTSALTTLLRLRVTLGYAVALVAIAATLLTLGPEVQAHVIRHMSTNLHNLGHGRIGTLIGSAFITSEGPMWVWLPGIVSLLALAELLWRSRRVLVTFLVGHVGATLIVAAGLATALNLGWLPISITRVSDVGMSYGAAAVLGALTAAIPARWRFAWIGWWLSIGLMVVFTGGEDFTDVGHFVALLLGILVSIRFESVVRWTRIRAALLVVGAAFSYIVFVNTELSLILAPVAGLTGAFVSHLLAARLRARRVGPPVVATPAAAAEPAVATA